MIRNRRQGSICRRLVSRVSQDFHHKPILQRGAGGRHRTKRRGNHTKRAGGGNGKIRYAAISAPPAGVFYSGPDILALVGRTFLSAADILVRIDYGIALAFVMF
jgi:hypothetical protein